MKLSDVKISSHVQFKPISDSQVFRSTQRSDIIHGDNFLLHHARLGMRE